MNTRPNFGSILDEAPTEVKYPPAWPQGSYVGVVKAWEEVKSDKKGTPGIAWTILPMQAFDDVNEDELKEFGALGERMITHTIWTSEKSVFMLDEFHSHCGLDLAEKKSRRLRNDECVNMQVGVFMKQVPTQDGTRMRSEVGRIFSVE